MTDVITWQGEVERLAWGGRGVARMDDGRVVLLDAPLALFPGEVVEAELTVKSRHAEGTVSRWVKQDDRHISPACPVAESCGGCTLWGAGKHAGDLKRQTVEDLLHRQLKPVPEFDWRPAPETALRSRIQLHWDGMQLGFHRRRTNEIVVVEHCPAAVPEISQAICRMRAALMEGRLPQQPDRWELACGTPAQSVLATTGSKPGKAWLINGDAVSETSDPLVHNLGGYRIIQPPGTFFQASPQWAWDAFGAVLTEWDILGNRLCDLYGGVGWFSLMLSGRFAEFSLVEEHPEACRAARENLNPVRDAGKNVQVSCCPVEQWMPGLVCGANDVILLDPPRAGLSKDVSSALKQVAAGTIVLVGCDGMAFSRDVNRLEPEWRLEKLAAIDLFPNTPAAEFTGLLKRT